MTIFFSFESYFADSGNEFPDNINTNNISKKSDLVDLVDLLSMEKELENGTAINIFIEKIINVIFRIVGLLVLTIFI